MMISPAKRPARYCALLGGIFALVGMNACFAQNPEKSSEAERVLGNLQGIRDQQPADLGIRLNLAKASYSFGTPVEATITGTNTSGKDFEMGVMSTQSYERMTEISVFIEDEQGALLPDPLAWRQHFGGWVDSWATWTSHSLADLKIQDLVLNRYRRIDKPGTYRAYVALSVQPAPAEGPGGIFPVRDNHIALISEKVPFTVTVKEPWPLVDTSFFGPSEIPDLQNIKILGFRQDLESQEQLFKLLNSDFHLQHDALAALYSQADLNTVAERLLTAVREGRVLPNYAVVDCYLELSTLTQGSDGEYLAPVHTPDRLLEKRAALLRMREAAIEHSGRGGEGHREFLLQRFKGIGHGSPEEYHELVAMQMDFNRRQSTEFIQSTLPRQREFLPVLRREAAMPFCQRYAAENLIKYFPDSIRETVIEDVRNRICENLSPDNKESFLPMDLGVTPELQDLFRAELQQRERPYDYLLEAINLYGDVSLLPELKGLYYSRFWNQSYLKKREYYTREILKLWIKFDQKEGLQALEDLLNSKTDPNSDWVPNSILGSTFAGTDQWEAVQPTVLRALENPQPGVVYSAIQELEANGNQVQLPMVLASLKRMPELQVTKFSRYSTNRAAKCIRLSRRWKLTPEQATQVAEIEALPVPPPAGD